MRLTILKGDSQVCVDGQCFNNLDFSFLPEGIHAVQWYHTHGEVEYVTDAPNLKITELGIYEQGYNLWKEAKRAWDISEQERIERELQLAKKMEEDAAKEAYEQALRDEQLRLQDLAAAELDATMEHIPD